jgi:hypothetical protein
LGIGAEAHLWVGALQLDQHWEEARLRYSLEAKLPVLARADPDEVSGLDLLIEDGLQLGRDPWQDE